MNPIICPICNFQNEATMNFCLDCGTRLDEANEVVTIVAHQEPPPTVLIPERPTAQMFSDFTPPQKKKSSKGLLLIGGVGFLLVLLFSGVAAGRYYFYTNPYKPSVFSNSSNSPTSNSSNSLIFNSSNSSTSKNSNSPTSNQNPSNINVINDPKHPIKAEYEKFAPTNVGQYKIYSKSTKSKEEYNKTGGSADGETWIEVTVMLYTLKLDSNGSPVSFHHDQLGVGIEEYASEDEAKKELNKRLQAAIPIADYDKKINLGKCDTKSENTDALKTKQIIKEIPLRSGVNVYYLAQGKTYSGGCWVINGGTEYLIWTQGIYLFNSDFDVNPSLTPYSKKGERILNDYLSATGQK